MKNQTKSLAYEMHERYFQFLATPYKNERGETSQPAKTKFVELLRVINAAFRPRFDLNACLAGDGHNGAVFFWSDLHVGHQNILRYCDRPFRDVEQMNVAFIRNCLARVTEKDVLVIGGDVTMNQVDLANTLLREIPAYKILVAGNHDVSNDGKLLKLEVDEVAACLSVNYKGRDIFVSHYPVKETLLSKDWINLHGHLHNTAFPSELGNGKRHASMCVELIGYTPRTLDELLEGI